MCWRILSLAAPRYKTALAKVAALSREKGEAKKVSFIEDNTKIS